MMQFTVFSSASTFWIVYLLCSNIYALPAESSYDLFDTSQNDLSSLDFEDTNPDFWDGGDLKIQSDDLATGFTRTSVSTEYPGSSDLFDSTTFSVVENDPLLASYVNSDAVFQQSGVALDAFGASCGLGARDVESFVNVDIISPRDDRDFGDIFDDGRHDCPSGKEPACCASGRPERVQNSIRMRPECTTWGKFKHLK